jgi:hypothetical protein
VNKRSCALLTSILLLLIVSQGVAQDATSREKLPNSTGIELLGNSFLYSFFYQRMLNNQFGLDAGLSILGAGVAEGSSHVAFVPFGAKFYAIPKNGSIFLTGGGVLLTASIRSDTFDDTDSEIYGYVGVGFEHRADTGFIFRFAIYDLFAEDISLIWPGLTFGYAF